MLKQNIGLLLNVSKPGNKLVILITYFPKIQRIFSGEGFIREMKTNMKENARPKFYVKI